MPLTPIYDTSYTEETIRGTKEIEAAKVDLKREPSYGRALALQNSRRIRNERVVEVRKSFRVVK